jgi:hypothetical protein
VVRPYKRCTAATVAGIPQSGRPAATKLPRDSVTPFTLALGRKQRERSMYKASKRYVAASAGALALAILSLLIAIAARSMAAPEIAADASEIAVQLRKSLPP